MEINTKVIRFPFWRTVSYANYMRKNKRLPILERKTSENCNNNNITFLANVK